MTFLPELLVLMHAAAVELEASDNLLEHHWSVHLLDDWKSLMLLAETRADELESAPVAAS
jgi:hypothetical protein